MFTLCLMFMIYLVFLLRIVSINQYVVFKPCNVWNILTQYNEWSNYYDKFVESFEISLQCWLMLQLEDIQKVAYRNIYKKHHRCFQAICMIRALSLSLSMFSTINQRYLQRTVNKLTLHVKKVLIEHFQTLLLFQITERFGR